MIPNKLTSRPNEMVVLNGLYDKWEEYFEMAGEQSPLLMNHVLAQMVMKEREENQYLRRRLNGK